MIKGAACLGIILHHLVQRVTIYGRYYKGPVTAFNYAGILFTGLFFFFSGYGLIKSLETKPDYLKGFLKRRLPAVLLPFWLVNLIEVLLEIFVYGVHKSPAALLKGLSGLTLLDGNGWFIIEIVVLYLAFYVIFRVVRGRDAALFLLCLFTVGMIVFSFFRGHDPTGNNALWFRGEWWFNSTGVFIFGLLYARFQKEADVFLNRRYPLALGAAAVLFVAVFGGSVYIVERFGYYQSLVTWHAKREQLITLLAQTAACLLFALVVLLLNMRITLRSRALRYVGGISLELFLVHGYILRRFFGGAKLSDPLLFAAVLGSSIACAAVISPCVKLLVKAVTGRLTWRKAENHTLESAIAEKQREKRARLLKILSGVCVGAVCVFWLIRAAQYYIFDRREYKEECAALAIAAVGDEVLWGRFETEPLKPGRERLAWTVFRREGGRVYLLSKEGVAGSYYNQKHEAVSWEDCDLRGLLNSEKFTGMFSRYEAKNVVEMEGDRITLLTPAEAEEIFASDLERELKVTEAAEKAGTNVNRLSKDNYWDMKGYRSSWWWLRGEEEDILAPIVTVDGVIETRTKAVNKPGGAIRPVICVECG